MSWRGEVHTIITLSDELIIFLWEILLYYYRRVNNTRYFISIKVYKKYILLQL